MIFIAKSKVPDQNQMKWLIQFLLERLEENRKRLAKKQKRASQPRFWRVTKRVFTVGALLIVLLGGAFALRSWIAIQSIIDRGGDGALALQDNVDPSQLNGEGDGRVNIMMLGIGGPRTSGW